MVETLVVSETMMSVYETVAVVVSRTTSADGVMVVPTGEPNRDTHAEYWACGFWSVKRMTCCRHELTAHTGLQELSSGLPT